MSKTNMHVQVNVTRNCLLEFLDILDTNGCHDICVTYSDYGWHVQYDSPFVHDPEVKGCDDPEPVKMYATPYSAKCCQGCASIRTCADKGPAWTYCGGKLYTRDFCSPQQIAEASCDGDKDKCGDACHAKH